MSNVCYISCNLSAADLEQALAKLCDPVICLLGFLQANTDG
jgi:hypothetical protein